MQTVMDAPVLAIQGILGAFSHEACTQILPEAKVVAFDTFEDTIESVREGGADRAVLPIDNSTYGRVADLHQLLPGSDLFIIGEHFMPIRLHLHGLPGTDPAAIETASSHAVALGQCREFLRRHGIHANPVADTAGAAQMVADAGDRTRGAICSTLAGRIYGLERLARDVHDRHHNTTRFLIMAKSATEPPADQPCITSFLFAVRNIPAALYKALGGFATNGVNMVKLESYMVGGSFTATAFHADIEGRPEQPQVHLALEELRFYCKHVRIIGVYGAHPHRRRSG